MADTPRQTSERFTRSGTRRSGDDYQDAIAVRFMLDWLRHPNRYAWQKVEADNAGALDDVVVCRKTGEIVAAQAKYSAHPDLADDPYDWEDLLDAGKASSKISLLGKWAASYRKLKLSHAQVDCILVSNRRPSDGLRRALTVRRQIDYSKIEDEHIRERLDQQLGGHEVAQDFLSHLTLELDGQGLFDLEDELRGQLLAEFGRKDVDWHTLKESVRHWVKHPDLPNTDGRILLRDVRVAAGWRRAQRLPEEYTLPDDFAVPDQFWHDRLVERVNGPDSEAIIIAGPPGSGKSTYLSFLFKSLADSGVTVLRHHYYLPEHSSQSRRSHDRVAHELMYQIEDQLPGEILDKLESLPSAGSLAEWVRGAAHELQGQGRHLVLIVDGLDHVLRAEHSPTELDRLLESVLPVPEGLKLVIGTQPLTDEILPGRLLIHSPRDQWKQMPRLTVSAIEQILEKHGAAFDLDETRDAYRDDLHRSAVAIEEHTSGYPLLVRYLIRILQSTSQRCDPWAVGQVQLGSQLEIEEYYRYLWHSLSAAAKHLLSLIAAVDLLWRLDWLLSCTSMHGQDTSVVTAAFREISHLLDTARDGVRVLHSSLQTFIRGNCLDGNTGLKQRQTALRWIETHAPEEVRWAYSWTLAADVGDVSGLIAGPNRDWVLNAFRDGRPLSRAVQILDRSATAALLAGDFPRHVELVGLATYLFNALEIRSDEIDRLEFPRLSLARARGHTPWNDRTSPEAISAWAEFSASSGRTEELELCFDLVAKYSARRHAARPGHQEIDSACQAQLWIAGLDSRIDDRRLSEFINRLDDSSRAVAYADSLGASLRAHRKVDRLQRLRDQIVGLPQMVLARHLAILLREEGVQRIINTPIAHPLEILLARQGESEELLPTALLGCESAFASRASYARSLHEDSEVGYALECLLLSAIHDHRASGSCSWLLRSEAESPWLSAMMNKARAFAAWVARQLQAACFVPYSAAFEAFAEIGRVSFTQDDLGYRVGKSFRKALPRIAESLAILSAGRLSLEATDIERVWQSASTSLEAFIDWCWSTRRPCITAGGLQWLADNAAVEIERRFGHGNERSTVYAGLASISIAHNDLERAQKYFGVAVEYVIGYGYHKDLNLHLALDVIDLQFDLARSEAWTSLNAIAPAIADVMSFTDGDETSHLREKLGLLLAGRDRARLPAYYLDLVEKEEYLEAQSVLHGWLTHAELNDYVERAIGRTAIDEESLRILRDRADSGVLGAAAIVNASSILFAIPAKGSRGPATDAPPQTEPPVDPLDYPPDRFGEFAARVRERYLGDAQVDVWLDKWIARSGGVAVLEALDRDDPDGLLGDPDRRFNLALETFGTTAAFRHLVRAQRRHGWTSFSSDQRYKERWRRVSELYPERWLEFVQSSAREKDVWRESDSPLVVGAPRLAEYLIQVGRFDEARGVARAFIHTALGTLAPFRFEPAPWVTTSPSELDLLMSRLKWPSGLVRERAAAVIGELMAVGSEEVRDTFLTWTGRQTLESQFLPPLLSIYRATVDTGVGLFDPAKVMGAIAHPSLASNLLLRAIFGDSLALPNPFDMHSGTAPASHRASLTFSRNMEVLPGIFAEIAREIDNHLPFTAQWSFEFDGLCDRLGATPTRPDFHPWGSRKGGYIPALDATLTEAYTSAYVRALAWAIGRRMPERYANALAAQMCPVDLSLWRVAPSSRPSWSILPTLSAEITSELNELAIRRYCEDILKAVSGVVSPEVVARFSTHIALASGVVDIELDTLIQTPEGPSVPSESAVREWACAPPTIVPAGRLISLDGGQVISSSDGSWSHRIGDWRFHRLAGPIGMSTSLRWQWWRYHRQPFAPAPYLTDRYRIERRSDRVVMTAQESTIGEWYDWNEGFQELHIGDLPPAMGCALLLKSELVREWAQKLKGKMCWLFTITIHSRKYDYEDYSKSTYSVLLGTTQIIQA